MTNENTAQATLNAFMFLGPDAWRSLRHALFALLQESASAEHQEGLAAREVERAETLDRICADHEAQIGLTLLKAAPATIPGTRLRGVAEAAGFRLAGEGQFLRNPADPREEVVFRAKVQVDEFVLKFVRP